MTYRMVGHHYPEYAGSHDRDLVGWSRVELGGFPWNTEIEILFGNAFTASMPWSAVGFYDPNDPPWLSRSGAWQHGPYGQGFGDTPTHWRPILL